VLRGGSWIFDSFYLRSSNRNGGTPDYADDGFVGFRVARAPL
jgi:formylglycine-generating enzyme required for sulfatase activity